MSYFMTWKVKWRSDSTIEKCLACTQVKKLTNEQHVNSIILNHMRYTLHNSVAVTNFMVQVKWHLTDCIVLLMSNYIPNIVILQCRTSLILKHTTGQWGWGLCQVTPLHCHVYSSACNITNMSCRVTD